MNHKALPVRLESAGDLYVMSTANSLAGLRIIEDGIVEIDVVLCREIVGVGCCPVLIQRRAYFFVSHTSLLISPYGIGPRGRSHIYCTKVLVRGLRGNSSDQFLRPRESGQEKTILVDSMVCRVAPVAIGTT